VTGGGGQGAAPTAPVSPGGPDIDERSLALGRELGRGGEGCVFELNGSPPSLVFKKYFRSGADAAALRQLVDLPARLAPGELDRLLRQAAWPLARVMNEGAAAGFVMPKIPDRFYGRNSAGTRTARGLQYLIFEPRPLWGDIRPPADQGRIALAREMASLLHFLHSHVLIARDISMNNILWVHDPAAAVFLIDCDSMRRLGGRPVHAPVTTPDWDDPRRTAAETDLDNDRYKCALLIGRVLSRSAYVHPGTPLALLPGVPDDIADAVQRLWHRAGGARGSRPDAFQWMSALAGPPGRAGAPGISPTDTETETIRKGVL
jgi:DNA-binding helix-hairpin-helix protein with protein kinase domain